MKTDFAITQIPTPSKTLTLKALWIVDADKTYDVKRAGAPENDLVAIRTIKGTGSITIEEAGNISLEEGTLLITKSSNIRRYYCSFEYWNFWWFEFIYPLDNQLPTSDSKIPPCKIPPSDCQITSLDCRLSPLDCRLPFNQLMKPINCEEEHYLVLKCLHMLRQEDDTAGCISSSLFSALLNIWLRNNYKDTIPKKTYEATMRDIAEYMKTNMEKNFRASELAKKAGLCEKRFRDVFTGIYGVSPKKYIERHRILIARGLLSNTSISVCEISEKLGYNSQFHFTREFKKVTGLAPSVYRSGRL